MTAVNGRPMRAKGSAFEREVVRVLREHGQPDAARAYGAGRPDDVGDIVGVHGYAIECKAHKALTLAAWIDEAVREATHVGAGTIPVVIAKRRNRPTEEAYAVCRLTDLARLISKGCTP